jgi:hypothetical protein
MGCTLATVLEEAKQLEQTFLVGLRDANTSVLDVDLETLASSLNQLVVYYFRSHLRFYTYKDIYRTISCKLKRIRKKVHHYLFDPLLVRVDDRAEEFILEADKATSDCLLILI